MSTVRVKGQDVQAGDDLWTSGVPHRVTRIEPYIHIGVTLGEQWRIAYSDGPRDGGKRAWGMTLSFDHGWAASYEISDRGDGRGDPHLTVDDYLSPFYGEGKRLHPQYLAAGGMATGMTWPQWLQSRQP